MSENSEITIESLASKACLFMSAGDPVFTQAEIDHHLNALSEWQLKPKPAIHRPYKLKNYEQTLKLVNAIANIAEINDHHPEVMFTYNTCSVNYSTHVNHGLTENDFICAAQIERAFKNLNY